MKNIIIVAALFVSAAFSFGQCTPDTSISTVGIYPGVAQGLDSAIVGEYYEQVLQVLPPADTTVEVSGLGVLSVPINFFRIEDVNGLPTGFDYSCDPPTCLFLAEEVSCVSFYGEVEWWMSGKTYPLEIDMTAQFSVAIGPIVTNVDSVIVVEGYEIKTNGLETSVLEEEKDYNIIYDSGLISATVNQKNNMSIYSITGQKMLDKELQVGSNIVSVYDLPKGIYILQIYNSSDSFSYKFIR